MPPFNDDKGSYCNRSAFNVTSISNLPPTLGQSSSTSVEYHTTLTQTSRISVHGVSVDVACHIDRVRERWHWPWKIPEWDFGAEKDAWKGVRQDDPLQVDRWMTSVFEP